MGKSLGTSFCGVIPKLNDKKASAPQWSEKGHPRLREQIQSPQGGNKFNVFNIRKESWHGWSLANKDPSEKQQSKRIKQGSDN